MQPDCIANDVGTILDGKEAVDLGLMDAVGGLDVALEALRDMIRTKKPEQINLHENTKK